MNSLATENADKTDAHIVALKIMEELVDQKVVKRNYRKRGNEYSGLVYDIQEIIFQYCFNKNNCNQEGE